MKKNNRLKIKALDFFCGAGGLTRGLIDAGIDVLAGIDNDFRLEETYQKNNSPSQFIREDINKIDIISLRQQLGITQKDLVLYAACAPCQPFSTLNKMEGNDKRKELLLVFAERVLKVAPPDFVIVENVPGLNNAFGKEVFEKFVEILESCGFKQENFYKGLLDAKDYGVPQFRKRFILLANRHGKAVPPQKSDKVKTIRDALMQYPSLPDGGKVEEIPNHEVRGLIEKHKIIVEAIPKDGGSRKDVVDTSILLECHKRHPNAHKDVFGRMAWDMPSPTLTCRCVDVYCGRFTHPEQNRSISLREAAAIQSFPNDYVFYGSFKHIAKQIGNAVPVELARRIGCAVNESIKSSI